MPSRAEPRAAAEWGLRVVVFALLAWAFWRAIRPVAVAAVGQANAAVVRPALERWITAPPGAVHVTMDRGAVLPAYARHWLVALRREGTAVTWNATTALGPTAIDAEPVADPRGATRVRVAAPGGATVVVRDVLGPLDSLRVAAGGQGVTVTIPASVRGIDGVADGTSARGAVTEALTLRRLLVLGRAGWEAKFLVRSLEEEGWTVDLRLAVTPKTRVIQGHIAAIDTARYAAVIAVDSSVAPAVPHIAAYVRSGGGLVVVGSAARVFRGLDSGTPGPRLRDSGGLYPVTALVPDAVVLERQGNVVAVAARRVERGRVVQVGYDDSWRWRMTGGDSAVARHRAWWTALVASVAYAPSTERAPPPDADAAPLAHLIDALGPPAPTMRAGRAPPDPTRSPWVFGALLAALLLEWGSRRLRGRR
jgi:hypothetical protein